MAEIQEVTRYLYNSMIYETREQAENQKSYVEGGRPHNRLEGTLWRYKGNIYFFSFFEASNKVVILNTNNGSGCREVPEAEFFTSAVQVEASTEYREVKK